jgi:hypothetical protein
VTAFAVCGIDFEFTQVITLNLSLLTKPTKEYQRLTKAQFGGENAQKQLALFI